MTSPWTGTETQEFTEYGGTTTIQFGTISFDDNNGVYSQDDSDDTHIFADYSIVNRYYHNPNTYMAGITSPGGFNGASVAFFQLASPTMLLIADWTACKTRDQPESPSPNPPSSDWVYLGALPELVKIDYAADGVSPVYRVSGIYIYGHKNPPSDIFSATMFPRSPEFDDASPRDMPAGKLKQGYIGQQGQGGNPPNLGGVGGGGFGPVMPGQ